MKILLYGIDELPHLGRSFRKAFYNLGHVVELCDERQARNWLDRSRLGAVLRKAWRRDQPFGAAHFNRQLLEKAAAFRPDIFVAIKGASIDPETLGELRARGIRLVNFSTDDPFNPVVSNRWLTEGISLWDVYGTPRKSTIAQLQKHCKGIVAHIRFAFDPEIHYPETNVTEEERRRFQSDLAFVGTCDRNRIPLLESLTRLEGVSVGLFGDGYYQKSPVLRSSYRGVALGKGYRLALGCSKIGLTLVRHTNRDHHTLRTFEVPACGAFMLAERTDEHLELFEENREAAFFSSEEELDDKIRFYLANSDARINIARAGRERVLGGKHTYQDRAEEFLAICEAAIPGRS